MNSAVTFLLARKHIPSATCRQKLASFTLDSCPSSQEGRRMLKSSPTNQHIFSKKTFQLKINRPREMAPEIPQKDIGPGIPQDTVGKRVVRILLECFLTTGRNEVVAKVIFLHLFVILFTGGGESVSASVHAGIPPPPPRPDTPRIRSTSGRYASYWNAFLLENKLALGKPNAFIALTVITCI